MEGDRILVQTVLGRLSSRLPIYTGESLIEVRRNEAAQLAHKTLLDLARTQIDVVMQCIVQKIVEVSKGNEDVPPRNRPPDLLASQTFLAQLLADCCTANWNVVESSAVTDPSSQPARTTPLPPQQRKEPKPLDDGQAKYTLEVMSSLAATPILSDDPPGGRSSVSIDPTGHSSSERVVALEKAVFSVFEYLSASNWSLIYSTLQSKLKLLRSSSPDDNDANILQFIAYVWINMRKLSLIIQEISQNILVLRKPSQNVLATLLAQTIFKWIENNPRDFVALHMSQRKLEGGADVLFDNFNTMSDNSKRRAHLWPLQTALLLLLPDAFKVAAGMAESKAQTITRKVHFLEFLRKALKTRLSDVAAPCLVSICQAASHFRPNPDCAILSFAYDVKNEMKDEIFKRQPSSGDYEALIERDVMAKAFVSLCRLNLNSVIDGLVPRLLEKSAPLAFKITVFEGCAALAQAEDGDNYIRLFQTIAPDIRELFHVLAAARKQMSLNAGNGISPKDSMASSRPNQQNFYSSSNDAIGNTELLYQMLELLKHKPHVLYDTTFDQRAKDNWDSTFERISSSLLILLGDEDETIRTATAVLCRGLIGPGCTSIIQKQVQAGIVVAQKTQLYFWRGTSAVCHLLSRRMLEADFRDPSLKHTLELVHQYLDTRVQLLRTHKEMAIGIHHIAERTISNVSLEVSLLVLLCSTDLDTCSTTTHTIALLCEEGKLTENMEDLRESNLTVMRNFSVYSELSLQSFRITGPVAFQKRLRRLLSKMTTPSPGILTAWEAVFMRWRELCKMFMGKGHPSDPDEKLHNEWRNYSGFLASVGGCCMANARNDVDAGGSGMDDSDGGNDDADSSLPGHRWIDRTTSDGDSVSLLERFMKQCLQLLVCRNVTVRENMKEVLGTELNPKLYGQLFQSLREEFISLMDNSGRITNEMLEWRNMFVEQAASLLKIIVDRTEETQDAFLIVDLGELSLSLSRYVDSSQVTPACIRIRAKVCQLVELLAKKKDILNLRQDIRVRNQLLQILSGWMSKPALHASAAQTSSSQQNQPNRNSEDLRLVKELDRSCLKALAMLLHRLPLQPAENHMDADLVDAKSQLFYAYFTTFLGILEANYASEGRREMIYGTPLAREESISMVDLTIVALSNLLSANVDVGLKHSLEIGYHQDVAIRTAFMHVLTNILTQGTEFGSLGDSAIAEKYERLVDLLINDFDFALAICDQCPSSEMDEMATALLNIFDSRGMAVTLLNALIEREVAKTESESVLLRRNCVATKMLSVFAKWKGADYLRKTLQPILNRLLMVFDKLDLELNPEKTTVTSDLINQNTGTLQKVTQVFIDEITASAPIVPQSFRTICHTISVCVEKKKFKSDAKWIAVGAFIFLRFFNPAIVAPDTEGLIDTPLTKEVRRGLVLITKIIQNLANNVLFGAKEPWMLNLNDFLTANIVKVAKFLTDISVPGKEEPHETIDADIGSTVAVHRFLYEHWEMVKRKLVHQEKVRRARRGVSAQSALSAPSLLSVTAVATSTIETNTITALNELIPSLGSPPQDITIGKLQPLSHIRPEYVRFQQFMVKNSGRSVESILSARILYDGGESKDGMPVICVILRNIVGRIVDTDLFIYCLLKIASKLWHKPFGILIDATCYGTANELPDDVYIKLMGLMPPEMLKAFSRYYVYNMNTQYRKSFRKVLRTALKEETNPMNPKNVEYVLLGNLQELQQHFHLGSLHLPKDTISLVHDSRYVFQPVTLSSRQGKSEVVMKIGSQYIQITTVKKQEICPGTNLYATINDIFRLTEIEDTNPTFHREDDNLFGIKTENGKNALFFSSVKRVDIVQTLKVAKGKVSKENRPAKALERIIRPEDVPGTLLNISLLNLSSQDHSLRLAAFELLCALCKSFGFQIDKQIVSTKGLSIPTDAVSLIVGVSEQLALSEPRLTFDFLIEFFVGWEKCPGQQRPLNILYMAPWLRNLSDHVLTTPDGDYEKGKERLGAIAKRLIDATLGEDLLYSLFLQNAWSIISQEESLLEVFVDELVKAAIAAGFGHPECEMIASICASFRTSGIRGKVCAKLRKVLHKTSIKPTRQLTDNSHWNEISVLLRICLALSFDSKDQAEMHLPELFHIITLTIGCGPLLFRSSVHSLLVNTVQSICSYSVLPEENLQQLKAILASLSEPKYCLLFNNTRYSGDRGSSESTTTQAIETISNLFLEVIELAAPSTDMANIWRARWMSLVASTAFQSNPAIQPRAFAVMGCLAKEDVDDDLLYQILVALRSSLSNYLETGDYEMLISIVISLSKMMANINYQCRYLFHLFWVAMSLARCASAHIFNAACGLIDSILRVMNAAGEFKDGRMVHVLMSGKTLVDKAAIHIDELFRIRFTTESFHHAVIASLIRGLHESSTRIHAHRVLTTFLDVSTINRVQGMDTFDVNEQLPPYLPIVLSRFYDKAEHDEHFAIYASRMPTLRDYPERAAEVVKIAKERALVALLIFAVIDFNTSDEHVQMIATRFLTIVATVRPDGFLLVYDQIIGHLNELMRDSQNSVLLEICRTLLCAMSGQARYTVANRRAGRERLDYVLKEWGLSGVWDAATFEGNGTGGLRTGGGMGKKGQGERERQGILLVDRLVDVCLR
ncbi:hypothetical protein BJ508DRAFT_415934 [Ascobolus immersus RN42]|uniref:Ras-GAP domain-containing protein n=1 Tax=Ascobolus immersus RN42 TaxID=1160509 RepID=A0A3N4I009_ASCIM|nr:hypothetical protein BJ508DRAFT_415934 [Ascobolus immersus RN42]